MPVDQPLIDDATVALGVTDIRELGAGGQKTVRLVDQNGTEVVMKVIALDSGSPTELRRAQREVELLRGLDSPHLVKVASDLVELGEPLRGAAWLEEHLDGDDLGNLLGAPWSWAETRAMAIEVGRGLGALHEVKVVHRDLSANNVRRTAAGRFVVMDPGFARHTLRSSLTVGGQPGTPGFLSPEHLGAFSGVPTPASDVFCVGILMFAALTTELPIAFDGDVADYISRLAQVAVTDIGALRADLSPEALSLIRRALHPQPARRQRNGVRLAESLEAIS